MTVLETEDFFEARLPTEGFRGSGFRVFLGGFRVYRVVEFWSSGFRVFGGFGFIEL